MTGFNYFGVNSMIKLLFVSIFLFMSGCATTSDSDNGSSTSVEDRNSNADQAKTRGLGDDEKYSLAALDDPNSPLSIRTIYFAFDSSELTPESMDVLIEHSRFMSLHPEMSAVLEGHADERGTRDYNLALGEKRGKSVQEYLSSQGVQISQTEVISYGEEKPVSMDHDESAWQLNRRVEIVYTK